MSKTTKLWINDNLELRHAINGWPDKNKFGWMESKGVDGEPSGWVIEGGNDAYYAALDKAKAESIPLEDQNEARKLVYANKDKNGISILTSMYADTFIEIEGELQLVHQWKNHIGEWIDCGPNEFNGRTVNGYITRQVARLDHHQTKDVNDSALPDANDKDVASIGPDPETEMTACLRLRLDMSAILYDNTASAQEKVITMKELLNKRTSKI